MSFLKRLTRDAFRDGSPTKTRSPFDTASPKQLDEHLRTARYGSFLLTEAVRPSMNLEVVPSAGWRRDTYRDPESGVKIPVIMAAQTKERLFDLFVDLLDPLGDEVDVVLETSHETLEDGHTDIYREQIDLPILKSILCDFEDLLTNDGCTGIAILNPICPMELQFDEHKLLIMYGHDLEAFERILDDRLPQSDTIRFITEAEHVHSSCEEFAEQMSELRMRLSCDE
ncbi:MAG: hypothetical protein DWH91_06725 [Planctomycetota bacterium]|nr:MAG: hypothetical protein DWH91_06725 [Planctomycetota bacterium]